MNFFNYKKIFFTLCLCIVPQNWIACELGVKKAAEALNSARAEEIKMLLEQWEPLAKEISEIFEAYPEFDAIPKDKKLKIRAITQNSIAQKVNDLKDNKTEWAFVETCISHEPEKYKYTKKMRIFKFLKLSK